MTAVILLASAGAIAAAARFRVFQEMLWEVTVLQDVGSIVGVALKDLTRLTSAVIGCRRATIFDAPRSGQH